VSIPAIICLVAAAVLLLVVVAWRFDPPLRSNLSEGSVTAWQRSDNPSPPVQIRPEPGYSSKWMMAGRWA
jgi:hypothetical protein